MKVEFLIAYDNKTWDTEVIDAPDELTDDSSKLAAWAEGTLLGTTKYRRAVAFSVYSFPSWTEDD